MSTLQVCWVAVAACTVIFLIVAAVSALPKMKAPYTAMIASIFLAASGITAFGSIVPYLSPLGLVPPAAAGPYKLPPAPVPGAPLANDASAGKVVFTFDDGPDAYTGQVIAELNALHLRGVFFVRGDKAAAYPELIRAEVGNGEVVGNHTWDHPSLTGKGTGAKPLSQAQVSTQLSKTNAAIVAAGAPEPSMWRPPYGGVSLADEKTAQSLGLRVVLDSGTNIIDSNDWEGLSAAQIAARVELRLKNGTIVVFHDGLRQAPQMIQALPLIVAYMNAHHLGATTDVRADATGGVVPYLGPLPAKSSTAPASSPGTPAVTAPGTSAAPPPASSAPARSTAPASTRPSSAPASTRPSSAPASTRPSSAPAGTPPPPSPAPTPTPTQTSPAPAESGSSPPPASSPPPSQSGGSS